MSVQVQAILQSPVWEHSGSIQAIQASTITYLAPVMKNYNLLFFVIVFIENIFVNTL